MKWIENIRNKPGMLTYHNVEYIRQETMKPGIKNVKEETMK